jgi:phage/plasmid-associated DNA primase
MVGDMSNSAVEDISAFKIITGGDKYVEGEIKGGKKYQFRNTVKIWYNANFIPKVAHYDEAFYVRWILINFPNRFPEDAEGTIPDVSDIICSDKNEMQGIIHESIKGAMRLFKRNHFRSEIVGNTEHIWKYNSDDMYAYIHDNCVRDVESTIPSLEFQSEYNTYLYRKGKKPITPHRIKSILEHSGIFKLRDGFEDEYGRRREHYSGIGWKPDEPLLKIKQVEF